jgi:hypothetical protein
LPNKKTGIFVCGENIEDGSDDDLTIFKDRHK